MPAAAGPRGTVERSIETLLPHYDRFGVERLCTYFHLGTGTLARKWEYGREDEEEIERCLARWRQRLIGCAILNAAAPEQCLAALDRWAAAGPMVTASRDKDRLSILYPSPATTADVVVVPVAENGRGGRLSRLLQSNEFAQVLAGAGWRVDGQPLAPGLDASYELPAESGLPRAGVLEALRALWIETVR